MDIVIHTIVPSENNEVSISKINANFRILSEQGVIIGDPVMGEKGEKGDDGKGSKGDRGGLHFLYDGSAWETWLALTKQKIFALTGDDGGLKEGDVIITSYTGVDLLTRISVATGGSVVQPNPADPSTYEIDFNAIINKGLTESESQSFRRVYEGDDIGKNLVAYDRIVGSANSDDISDFRLVLANNGNNVQLKKFTNADAILTISSNYAPVSGDPNSVTPCQIRLTDSIDNITNNLGVPSMDLYIGKDNSGSIPWTISAGRPDTINQNGNENKNLGLLIKAQSRYSNVNYAHNVYIGGNSLERAVGSEENTSIGVDGVAYCKKDGNGITRTNLALGHDGRDTLFVTSGYSGIFGKDGDASSCIGFNGNSVLIQAGDSSGVNNIKFNFRELSSNDAISEYESGTTSIKLSKIFEVTSANDSLGVDNLLVRRNVTGQSDYITVLLKIYHKVNVSELLSNRATFDMVIDPGKRDFPELATNARWAFQKKVSHTDGKSGDYNNYQDKYNKLCIGLTDETDESGTIYTSDVDAKNLIGSIIDPTLAMRSIPISISTGAINVVPTDSRYSGMVKSTGAISLTSGSLSEYTYSSAQTPTDIYTSAVDFLGTTGSLSLKSGQLREVSGSLTIEALSATTIMPKKLSESGGFTVETGGLASDSILINGGSKYSVLQKSGDIRLSTGSSNYVGGITLETGLLKKSSQYITWSETNIGYYDYGFYNNSTQALSASLVLNGYNYDNKDNWYLANCHYYYASGGSHSASAINPNSPYYFVGDYESDTNNKIKARFASPIEYSNDSLSDQGLFDSLFGGASISNQMRSWGRDVTKMGILRLSAGLDVDPYDSNADVSIKRNLTTHNGYYITKNTLEDVLVKNGSFYLDDPLDLIDDNVQLRTINESYLNKLGAQSLSLFSANTMLQQSFSDIVIHAGGNYGSTQHKPARSSNGALGQSLDNTDYRTIYLHKNFTYPGHYVAGTRTVVESADFYINSTNAVINSDNISVLSGEAVFGTAATWDGSVVTSAKGIVNIKTPNLFMSMDSDGINSGAVQGVRFYISRDNSDSSGNHYLCISYFHNGNSVYKKVLLT